MMQIPRNSGGIGSASGSRSQDLDLSHHRVWTQPKREV